MAILFKTTRQLESQIDEFLDAVSEGSIVFKNGLIDYLNNDEKNFQDRIKQIDRLEESADHLRRAIENHLYVHTLIPEHRGDVLGILESSDNVIDTAKETLNQFDIERPFIPPEFNQKYIELTNMSVASTESLVYAARAFFRDVSAVKDHLHKVYFYEKEADRLGDNLKREIFKTELDLSQKIHLRYFAFHIQNISDRAEEVADRLAIYTIKRTI